MNKQIKQIKLSEIPIENFQAKELKDTEKYGKIAHINEHALSVSFTSNGVQFDEILMERSIANEKGARLFLVYGLSTPEII